MFGFHNERVVAFSLHDVWLNKIFIWPHNLFDFKMYFCTGVHGLAVIQDGFEQRSGTCLFKSPSIYISWCNWSMRRHDRPRLAVFKVKNDTSSHTNLHTGEEESKCVVCRSREAWVSVQLYMAVNHVSNTIRGNLLFYLEKSCVCEWQ